VTAAAQGPAGEPGPEGLVHGMGKDLAGPDWSPLADDEVTAVLGRYDLPDPGGNAIPWTSPGHRTPRG